MEDSANPIPIENIYIITGVSSCEWKKQTKQRLPASIQDRVFHRGDLPSTFVNEIKNKRNVLIIMDEIQVAAKKEQTICKTFRAAGMLDKANLYENDIKILEYTATPDGTIYDLMKWGDSSTKILGEVGDGYVSAFDLLQQGRVKQYHDICGYNIKTGTLDERVWKNIREIKTNVDKYTQPKWHIIRTKNGCFQDITLRNFEKVFGTTKYAFIKYDRESEINDINNNLLQHAPTKHTFILIKEMLRCAKTIVKRHLGISYERYTEKPDDATIIQGLVGRNTGYDDNGLTICYTNTESIEKYETMWRSNFDDTTVKWNSKTTKFTNGKLQGKNTFNNPKMYKGFLTDNVSEKENNTEKYVTKQFKTQEEAKKYFIENVSEIFGTNGPKVRKPNTNGFYEATIKKTKKIWTTTEISNRIYSGTANNRYWFYPCYRNINDINTLEWWLIHE